MTKKEVGEIQSMRKIHLAIAGFKDDGRGLLRQRIEAASTSWESLSVIQQGNKTAALTTVEN